MIFAADLQNLVSASNDFEGRNDRTRARPGAKLLCDRTGDLTKLANFGAPGNMPILACYIFCFVCADPIDARKVGHPWTIEALAPAVGMSSSLIAQHLRCHHRRRDLKRLCLWDHCRDRRPAKFCCIRFFGRSNQSSERTPQSPCEPFVCLKNRSRTHRFAGQN
jgi:hypothetical protein